MKKTETLLISIGLFAALVTTGTAIWRYSGPVRPNNYEYPANKFGAFLAAQHAIYKNDFAMASKFSESVQDRELPIVRNTLVLSDFLSGRMPDDQAAWGGESGAPVQLIHDAHLILQNDWAAVYARHKKDESALAAPLRIWSSVATGRTADALKFIDALKAHESWKALARGQVYAESGEPAKAAENFANAQTDFMNINDYLYIMAFYKAHDMGGAAEQLHADFTERPGGMFMLDYNETPDWTDFSGYRRALTFSLIQSVSHTQVMMYSDLSLLLLRFAEIVQGGEAQQNDVINYYLGQYFFNNGGDFKSFFNAIGSSSPFKPFAMMKIAETTGKTSELERTISASPLFVPAITKLVAKNVQAGNKRKAIRLINRTLKNPNLRSAGQAFFLKTRAQTELTFGNLENAQADIRLAADILPVDAEILTIQARIWAAEGRELETAHEYAITLVRKNPSDIEAWDTLGRVIAAREGPEAALEMLERVGSIAISHSSLFEQLGDLYLETGNTKRARDAYARAIELSDDGMTIIPELQKKLRKLK